MCLMLYLAAGEEIPLHTSTHLSVQPVEPSREGISRWFSLPCVRHIGSHTGCSCGFPLVQSKHPTLYFDRFVRHTGDRHATLRSVGLLLDLIRSLVQSSGEVQLYPVWDMQEEKKPAGTIDMDVSTFDAPTFFLQEHYFYRVRDREGASDSREVPGRDLA
jgi:hypothetical protein